MRERKTNSDPLGFFPFLLTTMEKGFPLGPREGKGNTVTLVLFGPTIRTIQKDMAGG